MSLARTAYEVATSAAEPLFGLVMHRRLRRGKEVEGRVGERFARPNVARPAGPLVWLHGASIGETRLLLELARTLHAHRPGLHFLLTSQTVTAAELLDRAIAQDPALKGRALHQFAPLDSPAIARRFILYWKPDAAIFAEGEIWPNLLKTLRRTDTPTALVNARMTEKSLQGWSRWSGLSRDLFGGFDVILAADRRTADGLSALAGRTVTSPGNLKAALPPPGHDADEEAALRKDFVGGRPCLVAVSTHDGEEAFVLDALALMSPRPACIIVPRHPERAPDIIRLIESRGMSHARRSTGDTATAMTDVLLADTLGEVGLFARLADTVYLGGGHAPGVGGHNPIEIIRLGRALATGPDVFNFDDAKRDLLGQPGYNIVETPADLAGGFPFPAPETELIARMESTARAPMDATVDALLPLLPEEPR